MAFRRESLGLILYRRETQIQKRQWLKEMSGFVWIGCPANIDKICVTLGDVV